MSPTRTNAKGLALIQKYEGLRLSPYRDVNGSYKIGYGCPSHEGASSISAREAVQLLLSTLKPFEKGVSSLVKTDLSENQFSALVSFCFNVGVTKFSDSTLLEYLNDANYEKAALEFLRWDHILTQESTLLLQRREAERDLFLTPCFTGTTLPS